MVSASICYCGSGLPAQFCLAEAILHYQSRPGDKFAPPLGSDQIGTDLALADLPRAGRGQNWCDIIHAVEFSAFRPDPEPLLLSPPCGSGGLLLLQGDIGALDQIGANIFRRFR